MNTKVFGVVEQGETSLAAANDSPVARHLRAIFARFVADQRSQAIYRESVRRARARLWCPSDAEKAREAFDMVRPVSRGKGRIEHYRLIARYAEAQEGLTADPEYPGESGDWGDLAEEAWKAVDRLRKAARK